MNRGPAGGTYGRHRHPGRNDMTTFGIAIPQRVEHGRFDAASLQAFLRRAEELGFESGWTLEGVIGDAPDVGPLETLAFAAACTSRMRLRWRGLGRPLDTPRHLGQ